MIKDITIGQFFPGDSVIHKLDPRFKIIFTLVYIIAVFLANSLLAYTMVAVFVFGSIFLSRIPVKHTLRGLKSVLFIIAFTALFNLFLTEGEPLFSIGPVTATKEGLRMTLLMIARVFFLIIGTTLLTFTTSPIMLTDGIESLLKPFAKIGLPAHELAMMMTIALRFIPTLIEETDKIMKAQTARGADFESGNLFQRAKNFVPLLVPLFISAFRRADELATAMECRCYHGGQNRTRMRVLKAGSRDVFAAITVFAFCGLIVWTRLG
ncbi:MAG: energy-coupling factor transporter transmembrane protein EcfT [Ruminococcaceae bacterium]|nr:energy-coupling factor transporter transmembrane protein EcfT [Oscillospiraceae bacterium]